MGDLLRRVQIALGATGVALATLAAAVRLWPAPEEPGRTHKEAAFTQRDVTDAGLRLRYIDEGTARRHASSALKSAPVNCSNEPTGAVTQPPPAAAGTSGSSGSASGRAMAALLQGSSFRAEAGNAHSPLGAAQPRENELAVVASSANLAARETSHAPCARVACARHWP
jgi:hypothetical protein